MISMTSNPIQIGEDMTEAETLSLLETSGHGVLSLANGDSAYGIPISFGYDSEDERFLFEFLNLGESKKQAFVSDAGEVTLTVYNFESSEVWESAIVTGTIHAVDASGIPERAVFSFALQGEDGAEDMRWAGAGDLERDWYELRPTETTGRHRGPLIHDS